MPSIIIVNINIMIIIEMFESSLLIHFTIPTQVSIVSIIVIITIIITDVFVIAIIMVIILITLIIFPIIMVSLIITGGYLELDCL
jgi:hypothetical protein